MAPTGTIIVTGCGGGIGSEFVRAFLRTEYASSFYGIYICHPSESQEKLQTSLDEYNERQHYGREHHYAIQPLDLGKLRDVGDFTLGINGRVEDDCLPPLKLLLCLAGSAFHSSSDPSGVSYTHDGFEMSFGINFLSIFVLTRGLVKSIDPKEGARIIFMGSTTHNPAFLSNIQTYTTLEKHEGLFIDLETIAEGRQDTCNRNAFETRIARYGTSKFFLIVYMSELQRKLDQSKFNKVSIITMDPAAVGGTNLTRHFPLVMYILLSIVMIPIQWVWTMIFPNGRFRTAAKAGADLVFACFDTITLGDCPKAVYLNGTDISDSSPETHDEAKQRRLWVETAQLLKGKSRELEMVERDFEPL